MDGIFHNLRIQLAALCSLVQPPRICPTGATPSNDWTRSGLKAQYRLYLILAETLYINKDLTHALVLRGPAFANERFDACDVLHVERVLPCPVTFLDQVMMLFRFWENKMPMPEMVQKRFQGEDVRSLRELVLSRKRMAGLCILLRHGFHLDTTILPIQLTLQITSFRHRLGSNKDITDMNVAVDEFLLMQVDQTYG
jgi:hypothetical protein